MSVLGFLLSGILRCPRFNFGLELVVGYLDT